MVVREAVEAEEVVERLFIDGSVRLKATRKAKIA
jgi:hypothetical protein